MYAAHHYTPAEWQRLQHAQVQEQLSPIFICDGLIIKWPGQSEEFLLDSAHIAIVHAIKRLIDRMINSNK